MKRSTVGILALQGDYALHAGILEGLGVGVRLVRRVVELEGCDGLILPGGESTTLRKLLKRSGLDDAIIDFAGARPVLGTCAGCILLATELEDAQGVEPLRLLDIGVRRNGFGRQVDSFEAVVESEVTGETVAFIRAPRIIREGPSLDVLGTWDGETVAVRGGNVSALTFHPEVTGATGWHRNWLERSGL